MNEARWLTGLTTIPAEPPTVWSLLGWDPPTIPVLPVVAVLLASWYVVSVIRLHRMGRSWPWWSTVSFLSGCLILGAVMGLSIERYGFRLFSAFMFQQLTLSILVPPLLVLGAPGRLLLRSTPHHGVGRWVLVAALAGLRSRTAALLLHPAVTIPLFLFSYYGLYLSQLFDTIAATWLGHSGLEIFFLVSGLLFVIPILSTDPMPIRQTNLGRMFDIFVEMPLHVFIGVILMMAPRPLIGIFANPPTGWAVDPVKDQALAGALAWSYGEPIALATTLIFAIRWRREEQVETEARESDDARQEDELASYNRFLRQLQEERPGQGA
ncbi:cytochrome c oxidase assembly protein [Mycobacteroides salmoniphilum]|uniref:Cytochrome c oxidase caa3 assembly factor n=1 Tax=Mycobacteroides salmoniphilum TaxID=404941 RepID=A0A4R8SVV7_9MYCO|nr:cytochrome c oxidase assembly protein [Mycobacteroides salmoniphilum]TDZ99061.1 Cytochrome c oxidase caa3 assembly factor [Mycobacteroides salmoniphilum]TEA06418.1 Cytochrome c oxidase caa3 assembly factor [Mycobacteroides salmoniphilum]